MTTTRECAHCGERFSLVQRSGRDSYRARANRERSYHQEQRYCCTPPHQQPSEVGLQSRRDSISAVLVCLSDARGSAATLS